jgi:hypothetical protein
MITAMDPKPMQGAELTLGCTVKFETAKGKFQGVVVNIVDQLVFVAVIGYSDTVGFHRSHATVV